MNAKSIVQARTRACLDHRRARDHGVARARGHLGLAQPLGVGRRSVNASGWPEQPLRDRPEAAGIGELLDALLGSDGEMVAADPADPEQVAQLVLAVMRIAHRAGVGMRPDAGRRLLALRLLALHFDLDVFGLLVAGHWRASSAPVGSRADADSS
jgi:hypothetical protein